MRIAETVAETSSAKKLKVGAVCVKDHRILSIGYNGTPPDYDNNCEHETENGLTTRPEVIHAEQNAIFKMARDGQPALGATMFITHAPCMECAKAIKTCGINTVYYRNAYRSTEGLMFLHDLGVDIYKA
jgi:dCMP deaminase|nr:MAG TPA: deoxycytidylate deaminase [Caudoviricetes sp.]